MGIRLKHESGITKEVKKGFSWTVLFFGLIVPLIRGDIKWAAIMFGITAAISVVTVGFGAPFVGIVFSFVYNKLYAKDLVEKGYKPVDEASAQALREYGIDVISPASQLATEE